MVEPLLKLLADVLVCTYHTDNAMLSEIKIYVYNNKDVYSVDIGKYIST